MTDIYITIDAQSASDELVAAYGGPESAKKLKTLIQDAVNIALGGSRDVTVPFVVPETFPFVLKPPVELEQDGELRELGSGGEKPETLILPLRVDESQASVKINNDTLKALSAAIQGAQRVGADLAFETAYVPAPKWCRSDGVGRGFGTRDDALNAVGGDFLAANGLDGSDVNVVIVDQGLDAARLDGNFIGGWPIGTNMPGQLQHVRGVTGNYHGMLVARNILSVAPQARLYDCPLIPDRIQNVTTFLSVADAALNWVRFWINILRAFERFSGPWVIVNAWAIFDRSTEQPLGDYSENSEHSFNQLMHGFADDNIDVVFAAGNCGQFCPDRRCRPYDTGPRRSIYGAHAHARVLTVGAMRSDGLWAGASSQGPSVDDQAAPVRDNAGFNPQKPDLCAPSFFTEAHDGHEFNGGTSAASALAAGVVAALRSSDGIKDIPTDRLFEALRLTARRAGAPRWDGRLGFGMIDAEGAFNQL